MSISLNLDGEQSRRLEARARELGVDPWELAKAAVNDLLAHPADDFERSASIQRHAGPLADRVEFIPDATQSVIDEISCGIFFITAFWSGSAVQAFRRLVEVVHRLDPSGRLRFVVTDTDDIPHLHNAPPFIDILGGYGEMLWIKDGQIVAHSGCGLNLDCIEPNTASLLGTLA